MAAFLRQHRLTSDDEDFIHRVFKATGILTCQSFLTADRLFSRMTREEYAAYTRPALLQVSNSITALSRGTMYSQRNRGEKGLVMVVVKRVHDGGSKGLLSTSPSIYSHPILCFFPLSL